MTVVHLLIVLLVIGAVAAVAAGKVRGGLPAPTSTRPDLDLPVTQVGPGDIDAVRFSVGFRGYRMDEVDDVLDRLGQEIAERDRRLAELQSRPPGGPEVFQPPSPPAHQAQHAEPTEPSEPTDLAQPAEADPPTAG